MNKYTLPILVSSCAMSQAALISGVTATATTFYSGQQNPNTLVNNAGLFGAGPYDFSSLHTEDTSSVNQWHAGAGQGIFGSAPVVDNQVITFDLGGTYDLSDIHIWQHNQTSNFGRGVNQFDLTYSTDGGANYTAASSNLNLNISAGGNIAAQQFTLSQTGVTHVRIEIDSAHSAATNEFVGLSEVKFDGVATVPEPSSTALLGLGGLALILRRRK